VRRGRMGSELVSYGVGLVHLVALAASLEAFWLSEDVVI
jgi:hypothetical protein